MCGTTSPTKAITPAKATDAATLKATNMTKRRLTCSTAIPR